MVIVTFIKKGVSCLGASVFRLNKMSNLVCFVFFFFFGKHKEYRKY